MMTFNVIRWFAKLQVVSGFYGHTSNKTKILYWNQRLVGVLKARMRSRGLANRFGALHPNGGVAIEDQLMLVFDGGRAIVVI
jgi:hypothetical protein